MKYQANQVFTPSAPAQVNFVERVAINDKLVNALKTPGKQLIVYGHSGSGKSTLLVNKLHQTYADHITTRCMTEMTFEQCMLNAFDQLDKYYASEIVATQTEKISASIATEYLGIKSELKSGKSKEIQENKSRILPLQLTGQNLARFVGQAKCCWVLEDFHKLPASEKKKLSQLMKVFMDMAVVYPDLKIIAIGAVNTAREVVEYDPEMQNRIAEIEVSLMKHDELRQIAKTGQKLLNFTLSTSSTEGIVRYSNGLAAVCHQLGLNICFAAGIVETQNTPLQVNDKIFEKAIELYLENTSDTVKAVFDKAFRIKRRRTYDNCRIIARALAELEPEGATRPELYDGIRKRYKRFPATNLTIYLKQLQSDERGALINFDPVSGKYFFSDPFYRPYCLALFAKHPESEKTQMKIPLSDLNMLSNRLFEILKSELSFVDLSQPKNKSEKRAENSENK